MLILGSPAHLISGLALAISVRGLREGGFAFDEGIKVVADGRGENGQELVIFVERLFTIADYLIIFTAFSNGSIRWSTVVS